eukprot:8208972-Pyramimonas_sp.AAC.1
MRCQPKASAPEQHSPINACAAACRRAPSHTHAQKAPLPMGSHTGRLQAERSPLVHSRGVSA